MRQGYGEMYWNDGSSYKGQWEKGKHYGEGELMIPNKGLLKGRFVNNAYVEKSNGSVEEDEDENIDTPSARRTRKGYTTNQPNTTGDMEKEGFPDFRKNEEKPLERSNSQTGSKKSLVIPSSSGNVDISMKKRDSAPAGPKKTVPTLNNIKTTSEPELPDMKDLKAGETYNQVKKITYPQKTWQQAEGSQDSQRQTQDSQRQGGPKDFKIGTKKI